MPRRLVVHGSKARQFRDKAGMTQEQAAVRIGLAASSIRRIETGTESIQLATLGKLARLYKVKPEKLLRWV